MLFSIILNKMTKFLKRLFLVSFALFLCPSAGVSTDKDDLSIVKKAKENNKYIAVYFSGSDWCAICHVFKNEFVEQKEVAPILNADFVYYNANFPQRKKLAKDITATNDALAEKLNPNGIFPLLAIALICPNINKPANSGYIDHPIPF
jgi:thioredoxin-related protein